MSYTQRKYRKEVTESQQDHNDHEIRVRGGGNAHAYINRAASLLLAEKDPLQFVVLQAIGKATPIALAVSDKLRSKISLHSISEIKNIEKLETYYPKEKGLDVIKKTNYIPLFTITLTRNPTAEQKKSTGYQPPIEGITAATLDQIINFKPERREGGYRGDREGGDRSYRRDDRRDDREGGYRGGDRGGDRREDRGERVQTRGGYRGGDRGEGRRDNRDNRDSRDNRDNRDSRDNRGARGEGNYRTNQQSRQSHNN